MLVVPVACQRKYLPVVLDFQPQLLLDVWLDECLEGFVQPFLAVAVESDVVGVLVAVDAKLLIDLVHEPCQHQIGEILREVVADWQGLSVAKLALLDRVRCAVDAGDDFVQQPDEPLVLDFPAYSLFEGLMGQRWVELLDVDFEDEQGLSSELSNVLLDAPGAALDAP